MKMLEVYVCEETPEHKDAVAIIVKKSRRTWTTFKEFQASKILAMHWIYFDFWTKQFIKKNVHLILLFLDYFKHRINSCEHMQIPSQARHVLTLLKIDFY